MTQSNLTQRQKDAIDSIVRNRLHGYRLWGHRIKFSERNEIVCMECDMSADVPKIFRQSSGFREVIYKLYLLRDFKHNSCPNEQDINIGLDKFNDPYDIADDDIIGRGTYTGNSKDVTQTRKI